MLLGITNALCSFLHFVNSILQRNFGISVIAFIGNILVYSNSLSKNVKYVKIILNQMRHIDLH